MGVVEVRRVLRSFEAVLRIGGTIRRIRTLDKIGRVTSRHNMLIDIHERHLKDESEGVERVDIPIVSDLEHVVLEIEVVVRIGVILQSRRLAVRLIINIVLRKDLCELSESVGLLAAVVKHEGEHLLIQPAFDIAEIHATITGREHTVEAFHHIALGLDIDDTTLPRRIVFGGRIGDDLNLLDSVSVRAVKHGFELLTGEVRRLAVHPNLHGFTVHGNIAVLVDADTRRTAEDIVPVRTCRER